VSGQVKQNKTGLFAETTYFLGVGKHRSPCFPTSDFLRLNSEPYFFFSLSTLAVQLQEQNEKSLSRLP